MRGRSLLHHLLLFEIAALRGVRPDGAALVPAFAGVAAVVADSSGPDSAAGAARPAAVAGSAGVVYLLEGVRVAALGERGALAVDSDCLLLDLAFLTRVSVGLIIL